MTLMQTHVHRVEQRASCLQAEHLCFSSELERSDEFKGFVEKVWYFHGSSLVLTSSRTDHLQREGLFFLLFCFRRLADVSQYAASKKVPIMHLYTRRLSWSSQEKHSHRSVEDLLKFGPPQQLLSCLLLLLGDVSSRGLIKPCRSLASLSRALGVNRPLYEQNIIYLSTPCKTAMGSSSRLDFI